MVIKKTIKSACELRYNNNNHFIVHFLFKSAFIVTLSMVILSLFFLWVTAFVPKISVIDL